MKVVYFAAPLRINPEKSTQFKKEFLFDASWLLMDHDIHVESPHLKYLFTQEHPEYTTEEHDVHPELDKYARDQGIHLIEDYPIDAVVALTTPEERSDGMEKEVETANERGIPVHHFPYFTTEDDVLEKTGRDIQGLEDVLSSIKEISQT